MHYNRCNHIYLFEISGNTHQVTYFPVNVLPSGLKPSTYLFYCTHIHNIPSRSTPETKFPSVTRLSHTVFLQSRLELELPFVTQTDSCSLHCCALEVFNLLFVTTNNMSNNCYLKYSQQSITSSGGLYLWFWQAVLMVNICFVLFFFVIYSQHWRLTCFINELRRVTGSKAKRCLSSNNHVLVIDGSRIAG